MIDVQIVAGKRPELVAECVSRISSCEWIAEIFVADNLGLGFSLDEVTLVRNETPLTFEENHNRLAARGKSPFILFLDDDSFLFEGALDTLYSVISRQPRVAAVGTLNNQTFPTSFGGKPTPQFGSLGDFKAREGQYAQIASALLKQKGEQTDDRLYMPGNCLLVRRKVWQREYGGWDEAYRNWNEEVDFLMWCREREYETKCALGVWLFHCQAQSRSRDQLRENMVVSARHWLEKWPEARLRALGLIPELQALLELNRRNSNPAEVEASAYYRLIGGQLE